MSDFDWLYTDGIDFSGPVDENRRIEKTDPNPSRIVTKRKRRPKELVRAERKLTPTQRFYVKMLVETETIAAAERRMADAGFTFDRATFWRWRRLPVFAEALHLSQNYLFECLGISKERILNDAEKIKELALTPQPILHQGRATGFKEVQLGAALRALELQGKGVGLNEMEAQRILVNIDIDFSGRVEGIDVIEGESEHVE